MKYAWFCAHCGKDAYFTNRRPYSGMLLAACHWHNLDGCQVKKGTPAKCPYCLNPLVQGAAYIKSSVVQNVAHPQSSIFPSPPTRASSRPSDFAGPVLPTSPPAV